MEHLQNTPITTIINEALNKVQGFESLFLQDPTGLVSDEGNCGLYKSGVITPSAPKHWRCHFTCANIILTFRSTNFDIY